MKFAVYFEKYSEPHKRGFPTFGYTTIYAKTIEEAKEKAIFKLSTSYQPHVFINSIEAQTAVKDEG